ncbi:MAG: PAS domain S-box protein [Anaerolineales bacterium]|nr:PAS domain S-box protein [Anaerolineales bacterium]
MMKITPSYRDLIILFSLNLALYGLFVGLGLFEWLNPLCQLPMIGLLIEDQIHLGLTVIGLSCAIFAWRRWADLNRETSRREEAQAALIESEARFRQIMDHLEDIVHLSDVDGHTLYVNSAYEKFTGRSIESLHEQPSSWRDTIHSDDQARVLEAIASFKDNDNFDMEYRVTRPDGTISWVRDRAFPIRTEVNHTYRICGTIQDITARKQMEETLREREQFIQRILTSTPNLIFIYNLADQSLVFSNHQLADVLGYRESKAQTFEQQLLSDYLHPDDIERYQAHLDELRIGQPGEIMTFEYRLKEKDGGWRWFRSHETVFKRDQSGQTLEVLGIADDITNHKEILSILKQERAYLRQVIDAVPGFIGVKNMSGRLMLANQTLAAAYNTTVDRMVGKTDADFNPNRDEVAFFQANDQETLATGQVQYISEEPVTYADGQTRWHSTYKVPLFNPQGQPAQILFVSTDITERKSMEAALRSSQAQYQSVIDHIKEVIFQTDAEGRWTFLNPAWTDITGFALAESLGQNFLDFVHPDDRLRNMELFQPLLERKKEYCRHQIRYLVKASQQGDDFCWIEVHARLTLDADGNITGTSGMLHDVTEVKRAEEAIQRLNVELEERVQQRTAELSQANQKLAQEIIERQRAEAEIQRRNRELMMFNHISDASMSAADPVGMLTITCQELVGIFDLAQAQVVLFNEAKTEARVVAEVFGSTGLSRLNEVIQVNDVPLLQQILAQKSPLTPESSGFTFGQFQPEDLLDGEQVESALVLPLGINEDIVGVLSLGATRTQAFFTQDFALLWGVADQISAALTRIHLAQNQKRLATVMDQVNDAVIITDPAGHIVYVNPAFEQMTGYCQVEVLGQTPRLLKSGKNDQAFYAELWSTITEGHTWRGRSLNKKKDGTFYTCDMAITPVFDEYGEIINFVAIERDVSQSLQLEEQYRQAQKMESVGRLASGVAHDFNNILTAIIGYTGLSIRALPDDSPIRANLQGVEASAERAANLTRQLLAFARKQVIELRPVNLNELIAGSSKILRRLISENIELVILSAADLGWAKADPGQLEQVLFNLVVNAHDAMPNGGKLILETTNVTLTQAEAECCVEVTPGDYVLLSVIDTGIGMNDEVKAHIFEPFFTTKAPGKGTGLGLATCFGIIKQSNGHIWVESEPNKGTTFKVFLPRSVEAASLASMRSGTSALPGGNEIILVVEDEPLARDTSVRNLRELGYTVLEAGNGEEALREIDRLGSEKLQLLITDLVMPQLGGKALVELLKPAHPDLKILLMSGYTEEILTRSYLTEIGAVFCKTFFARYYGLQSQSDA